MYPMLADLKAGDRLIADDGFDCIKEDAVLTILKDEDGDLYVPCANGIHLLVFDEDKQGFVVGFRRID